MTKIYFFLDGVQFAQRKWAQVPRVGENVLLEDKYYQLMQVIWDEGIALIEIKARAFKWLDR